MHSSSELPTDEAPYGLAWQPSAEEEALAEARKWAALEEEEALGLEMPPPSELEWSDFSPMQNEEASSQPKDNHTSPAALNASVAPPMALEPEKEAAPIGEDETNEGRNRGVFSFPPLGRPSFYFCGDNGSNRWVTHSCALSVHREVDEGGQAEPLQWSPGKRTRDYGSFEDEGASDSEEASEEDVRSGVWRETLWTHGAGCSSLVEATECIEKEEAERASKAMREAEVGAAPPPSLAAPATTASSSTWSLEEAIRADAKERAAEEDALYVKRFRPRAFRELLSDDTQNLRLLQWLQSWSPYVFGHPANEKQAKMKKGGGEAEAEEVAPMPPDQRIVVLTGPPGCGKTVLVEVLAEHCGYELMQINASSERNMQQLKRVIQLVSASSLPTTPAQQALRRERLSSVLSSTNPAAPAGDTLTEKDLMLKLLRPKCLLLDEVDGIMTEVVEYLLEQEVHRPVFCVCNDIFAPSLRKLRRECGDSIYYMEPIPQKRLVSRLEEVVDRLRLIAGARGKPAAMSRGSGGSSRTAYPASASEPGLDQGVLSQIVNESAGDIRSCLNTLQFLMLQTDASSSGASLASMYQQLERDRPVPFRTACQAYLSKLPLHQAVSQLRQDFGVDYEAMVAEGGQAAVRTSRQIKRRGDTASREPAASSYSRGIVAGYRVDPGCLLRLCSASAASTRLTHLQGILCEGLFEHYLAHDCLLDYTLEYIHSVADAFAFQDVLNRRAFSDTGSELFAFASRYEFEATCQTLYAAVARCGRSNVSEVARLRYPSERYRLRQQQLVAQSVRQGLEERWGATELAVFWLGDQERLLEWSSYMLHCLYDLDLLLSPKQGSRRLQWSGTALLPPNVRESVERTVARHVVYGLRYTAPPALLPWESEAPRSEGGGGEGAAAGGGVRSMLASLWATPRWRLDPDIEVAGSLRCCFSQPQQEVGGAAGAFGKPPFTRFASHTRGGRGVGGTAAEGSSKRTKRPPTFFAKDDLRQYLVAEISRSAILSSRKMHRGATAAVIKDAARTTAAVSPAVQKQEPVLPKEEEKPKEEDKPRKNLFDRFMVQTKPKKKPTMVKTGEGASSASGKTADLVRYLYFDGATNAVKVPAVWDHF